MVRNIPFLPRDNFSPRDQWSSNDRYMNASPLNTHHFSAVPGARPSVPVQAVETALREQCGIQIKDFALIATLEDGTTHTFTSEKLMRQEKFLFNDGFKDMFFRQTNGHYGAFPAQMNYNNFEDPNLLSRRQSTSTDSSSSGHPIRCQRNRVRQDLIQEDSDEDSTATPNKGRNKRLRGSQDEDEDKVQLLTSRVRNLRIGDTEEVTKFLESRFRDLQQAACKIIAKAFVKVVEPKKQTNHPYTGGAERAPKWWPPLPSPNRTGGVKHREPDHLLKPERIALLIHILRIGRNPGLEKENVTIKELQAKTKEAMLSWFGDKPENRAKQKFLDEIFKVARAEERYRNGEIDGSTLIPVMHGADQCVPEASEDECDDAVKEEEDNFQTMTPQSQICTPDSSVVSPTSTQSHSSIHRPMSSNNVSEFGTYREIPVRAFHNAPTHPGMLPRPDDQSPYENCSLNMGVQSFLPPRMTDLQQPQHNHGLPHQGTLRRPTWNPSNSFPANNPSNLFAEWPGNNMMRASSVQQYTSYPAVAPTPLASNGPLLPLPNSSSVPSLLPPMVNHIAQQTGGGGGGGGFHDPAGTMHFRPDQNNVNTATHHGMGAASHNSLRKGSLSNPHHQYHHSQQQQQPAYMNDFLHDYSGHADEVMKNENIGNGGGG